MDFSGVDAWLRVVCFGGIFLACAGLAIWANMAKVEPSWRLYTLAGASLATIPAAIVAAFEDGTALSLLAALSISAFALSAAVTLVSLRTRTATTADPLSVPVEPRIPRPAADATRVGTFASVTAVSAQPAIARTEAIAIGAAPHEIAFLIEYSGDGRPHRLGPSTSIGRTPDAGIVIESGEVSREHALVKLEDGRFVLHDLGTTNGTQLVRAGRRRKVTSPTPLADLDIIEMGPVKLAFIEVRHPLIATQS